MNQLEKTFFSGSAGLFLKGLEIMFFFSSKDKSLMALASLEIALGQPVEAPMTMVIKIRIVNEINKLGNFLVSILTPNSIFLSHFSQVVPL